MDSLAQIQKCLKGKVLVMGIGNTFRSDDGAGPALIKSLKSKAESLKSEMRVPDRRKNSQSPIPDSQLLLMDVGEVPENYLEKVVELRPDTILLVDAGDFNAPPGSVKFIDAKELGQRGFSTHSSSLKLVIDYLSRRLQAEILLLGIQPENLEMGAGLSKRVKEALKSIAECLRECMS